MRIHELALQAWCYRHFHVTQGYPVPVIFATPRDAFAEFTRLWTAGGPFSYLLDAKDEQGTPLYEPYPSNVRYPLISIARGKWSSRPAQNWSLHINRKAYYPTKATLGDGVALGDMGNVVQARHPQAWNFSYQLEFYCKRPDTQAMFVQALMNAFPTQTSSVQTWIPVIYPGWFGLRQTYCRMFLDSEIDPVYDLDTSQSEMEYRTSFSVVVEGYNPDLDRTMYPVLWYLCTLSAADMVRVYQSGASAYADYTVTEAGTTDIGADSGVLFLAAVAEVTTGSYAHQIVLLPVDRNEGDRMLLKVRNPTGSQLIEVRNATAGGTLLASASAGWQTFYLLTVAGEAWTLLESGQEAL